MRYFYKEKSEVLLYSPDFSLRTLDGEDFSLRTLDGEDTKFCMLVLKPEASQNRLSQSRERSISLVVGWRKSTTSSA